MELVENLRNETSWAKRAIPYTENWVYILYEDQEYEYWIMTSTQYSNDILPMFVGMENNLKMFG